MWSVAVAALPNLSNVSCIFEMLFYEDLQVIETRIIHPATVGWHINSVAIVIPAELWCVLDEEGPFLAEFRRKCVFLPPDKSKIFDASAGAVIDSRETLTDPTIVSVELTPMTSLRPATSSISRKPPHHVTIPHKVKYHLTSNSRTLMTFVLTPFVTGSSASVEFLLRQGAYFTNDGIGPTRMSCCPYSNSMAPPSTPSYKIDSSRSHLYRKLGPTFPDQSPINIEHNS